MAVKDEISSRQVMEEIVTRSALIFAQAIKDGNKGNDNLTLRDIKSIFGYTATEDLPEHLQKSLKEVTEAMFKYITSKGYVLIPRDNNKRK